MKADLANNWILMSILPYGVADDPEFRNKYVACMLGDELATWNEFLELGAHPFGSPVLYGEKGTSCKFNYGGSCFHPFLPGSMVDAIFSDCMRGHDNAGPLVNKTACEALDSRSCRGCCLHFALLDDDSGFEVVRRFYDRLIEIMEKDRFMYWNSFEEFQDKECNGDMSGKKFLKGGFSQYDDNVRDHFDKMMRWHFKLAHDACRSNSRGDDSIKEISKAMMLIRLDLVTHWRNYWAQGKYKEKEV